LHPVAAIEIRYATPADIQQAKVILAARQERDQARYDDIARLADLTFPYLEGTEPVSEILPRMPDAERAEATDIFNRLRPAEPAPGSDWARAVELAKLDVIYSQLGEFISSERPRLFDGKPIPHPETGEPLPDPNAALDALELQRHIIERQCCLRGIPLVAVTASADDFVAKLAELEERYPPLPSGDD
jgi:hypothetical protein